MSRKEPAFFYLHGFASGIGSTKAQRFVAWGERHGIAIEPLDLRVPSFERLRLSAIVARIRRAIDEAGGDRARAALIGSSLGGLAACRAAAEDPRICAVLAMAPAFGLADRWRVRLGEEAFRRWQTDGWLEVDDYATGGRSKVDHGFYEDLARVDQGEPDVRVPVTIVHGRNDEVVDIERSRSFARGKRHVRLVEVDDGHDLVASLPCIFREAERLLRSFGIDQGTP